ncbi:MAG: 4-hydroxybenzoate octaprenyltransferase [Hyphomicrobiales bacterium]
MTVKPEAGYQVADTVAKNWVNRLAPQWARPYCQLSRLDRPIGIWLLLIPCWWSLGLAQMATRGGLPDPWLLMLFAVGAVAMRGAGCTYNDIIDRNLDAHVARTRSRPIPSGRVSVCRSIAFMITLSLIGLIVLVQFNRLTIALALGSLIPVAIYPFMKRITHWPQIFLGLTFNWGALLGWTAVLGRLDWPAVALYAAGVAWTLGYDTIYAFQDREDDAIVGIKSTALRFGANARVWLTIFYTAAIIGFALAGAMVEAGVIFWLGLGVGSAHMAWQLLTLDTGEPERCLALFRSNRDFGLIMAVAVMLEALRASL